MEKEREMEGRGEMGRDKGRGRENTLVIYIFSILCVFRSLLTMVSRLVHHFRSFNNVPSSTHKHTPHSHLSHRYLNLHGSNIRKMEALEPCTNLRVLVLSFNEVHKVEGIAHMKHLERLEVRSILNTDNMNRVRHNNMINIG